MTPELESEGYSREIARKIQSERKKKGLKKENTIDLKIYADGELQEMLSNHLDFIKQRTGAKTIKYVEENKDMVFFTIKSKKVGLTFRSS